MGDAMILEFKGFQTAQECLNLVNQSMAEHCRNAGYLTYESEGNFQTIGKNTATGKDSLNAVGTASWDVLQESPDNTYYFESPSCSKILWRAMDKIQGFDFVERPYPEAWHIPADRSFIVSSLQTLSKRLLGVFRG